MVPTAAGWKIWVGRLLQFQSRIAGESWWLNKKRKKSKIHRSKLKLLLHGIYNITQWRRTWLSARLGFILFILLSNDGNMKINWMSWIEFMRCWCDLDRLCFAYPPQRSIRPHSQVVFSSWYSFSFCRYSGSSLNFLIICRLYSLNSSSVIFPILVSFLRFCLHSSHTNE